jgi:ferrochelatase
MDMHAMAARKGIVIMNLGSPDSASVADVRRYLNEFLMDKRVIDSPWLLRFLLVRGIITPLRAPKSARAYGSVWTTRGSPLIVISEDLKRSLQKRIPEPLALAMRYGSHSPGQAFRELLQAKPDIQEVLLLPLYPQYAMSSFETAVAYAKEIHRKGRFRFRLRVLRPFYDSTDYLEAISLHIGNWLDRDYDQVLFSFHGLPERHLQKTDITGTHCLATPDCCAGESPAHTRCYRHQCLWTTQRIAERLSIPATKYSYAFQSRLGREPWLKPYTDLRLEEMPGEGIRRLLVVCPAFVSDCLETLEEIALRGRESFLKAGGESFTMIPCLNTEPAWVGALEKWIKDWIRGDNRMVLEP